MKLLFHILISAGLASPLWGDAGRTSANYSIVQESTGTTHGGRSTSANYTLDTSSSTAGGQTQTEGIIVRDGYSGQLVDPAVLTIQSAGAYKEEDIFTYGFRLFGDDGSSLENEGATAETEILSGPLESPGGATISVLPVFQDETASFRATVAGLSKDRTITVSEFIPDNFGLYAKDRLPDDWQAGFFGANNPLGQADADGDGDGHSNRFEFFSGHSPADSSEILKVVQIEDKVILSKAIPNRLYEMRYSEDLITWTKPLAFTEVTKVTFEHTLEPGLPEPKSSQYFHQLLITKPKDDKDPGKK